MGEVIGLTCHRCGTGYPPGRYWTGCPACAAAGKPSNLLCEYDYGRVARTFSRGALASRAADMWRYREFLPADREHEVSISEGSTPLVACPSLGQRLGFENLYVKDESRNPTWSFKDRMASAGASRALQMGLKVLTAASSGNGGAAVAAYAARAGLDAVILTTPRFPLTMRTLMQAYNAKIIATETMQERWTIVNLGVLRYGWFPTQNFMNPPIGANPYALDGCKTMGYEICEQMRFRAPDWVICPVGSGDSMTGIWRGIQEWIELGILDSGAKMPRMVAAEVFGSLTDAMERGLDHTEERPARPTVAVSTAVLNSAYQSLKVLRVTDGAAVTATDDEIMAMQLALAAEEGVYAEASAVLTLAVAKKMLDAGHIRPSDSVVALLTSGGLKDPEVTAKLLPPIPVIEATEDALRAALQEKYGVALGEPAAF